MIITGGINHITLRVQNLKRSEAFYSKLLGLEKVGSRTGMDFYSSGQYNHELALTEDASYSGTVDNGLLHIAFNVENGEALDLLKKCLLEAECPVGEGVDHIISHSIYTQDPDGYVVELTTDLPRNLWKENTDAFKKDYTL